MYVDDTSATNVRVFCTLSTANNSESDTDLTFNTQVQGASGTIVLIVPATMSKFIKVATKTTHYLNALTTLTGIGIINLGNGTKNRIEAVLAYL